jgi:uncharacterized coiled-coil DUF342 family protein
MALTKEEMEFFTGQFDFIQEQFSEVRGDIAELRSDVKYLDKKIDQTKQELLDEIRRSDQMHEEDIETVIDDVKDHDVRIRKLELAAA